MSTRDITKFVTSGVVIIILAVGVNFIYKNTSKSKEGISVPNQENTNSTQIPNINVSDNSSTPEIANDTAMAPRAGSYEAYSSEKVAKKGQSGKVVLFFRASWCPTCRTLDRDIKENLANIPANVTILDVNYDDSDALKRAYGVTYQHTLVEVDSKGDKIKLWSGSPTLADLLKEII